MHVPRIFASVHSQTSSSDNFRFARVFLTDIGTAELPDDTDDPLGPDIRPVQRE